jgi:hypothetical protein
MSALSVMYPNALVLSLDLQQIGRLSSLTWQESLTSDVRMWVCICKSESLKLTSYVVPRPYLIVVDGEERGRGTASKKHIAKDQAADEAWTWLNNS